MLPTNALFANNTGSTFFRIRQYEQAALWYQKAIANDPARAIANVKLGDAYLKLQNKTEAEKAFRKDLGLMPNGKSADYARAHLADATPPLH